MTEVQPLLGPSARQFRATHVPEGFTYRVGYIGTMRKCVVPTKEWQRVRYGWLVP